MNNMQMQLILGLFFAVLIALFALQNSEPVTVRVLVFALEGVALPVIILLTAALAAAATMLLGVSKSLGQKAQVEELRRELAERKAQIAQLQAQGAAVATGKAESASAEAPSAEER